MKSPKGGDPTDVLGPREVVSSTELIRRLEAGGYAHARKVLERSFRTDAIWRSTQLVLPGGGRLFARHTFYGDAAFLAAIEPHLLRSRPGIARVLHAMGRFQALDIDTVKKLLAVKLDPDGQGKAFLKELGAVVEAGIGRTERTGTARLRLVRAKHAGTEEGKKLGIRLYAETETERRLLALLMKIYRQQNLIAWNTPEPGHPKVYNNGQLFSAIGYSPLRPLRRHFRGTWKKSPVPFESLTRSAELFDVEGFIERLHRAGDHSKSKLRFLGVMGARSFSPEAFERGKKFGLAMVNYRELFGESGMAALTRAQELLAGLAENDIVGKEGSPSELVDRFADSIASLKGNPMVSDLCGIALETFAVAVLRARKIEGVQSGLDVPCSENGLATTRDVDVSGFSGPNDDEWHVLECKAMGREKDVSEEIMRKFFLETVPAFIHHIGKPKVRICHAQIWTTGRVSAEALTYLGGLRLDRRVQRAILTRDKIEIPNKIGSLARLLDVIAEL